MILLLTKSAQIIVNRPNDTHTTLLRHRISAESTHGFVLLLVRFYRQQNGSRGKWQKDNTQKNYIEPNARNTKLSRVSSSRLLNTTPHISIGVLLPPITIAICGVLSMSKPQFTFDYFSAVFSSVQSQPFWRHQSYMLLKHRITNTKLISTNFAVYFFLTVRIFHAV